MSKKHWMTWVAAILVAGVAWGQQNERINRGQVQQRGAQQQRPDRGSWQSMMRFDTNHNLVIEEDELAKGLDGIIKRADETYALLLQLFDKDEDGTLGEAELRAAQEFVLGLISLQRYDRNRDLRIDAKEGDQLWTQMADSSQTMNERIVERHDTDKNGELGPDEIKAAQEQHRNRQQRGDGR